MYFIPHVVDISYQFEIQLFPVVYVCVCVFFYIEQLWSRICFYFLNIF